MTFADDVRRDLARVPKQLQSKYLYDALGSALFDAICRLPWYRIMRAEMRLLARHADAIVSRLGDPVTIVELGCGSGEKLSLLADAANRLARPAQVHLIDISPAALELSGLRLGALGYASVFGHQATYEAGLRSVGLHRGASGSMLVLFLGSNLGNFDRPEAAAFLRQIHDALRAGDVLLLGADLVKPEADLLLAYDDPIGLTAAFNKNLLLRINRELQGEFDLTSFDHQAVWVPAPSRVEMRLVSRRRQRVRIAAAGIEAAFDEGEAIWTESSYKYEPGEIVDLAGGAGFACRDQWIDAEARFALTALVAA